MVWGGQDGSGTGVRARRLDASGVPIGAEFSVNVTTQGGQGTARIAKNEDDSYTIYWQSSGHADGVGVDIVGRRFDAAGVAISDEFIINTTTTYDQLWPQATTLADGRHLVTWANANASGTMVSVSGRIIGAGGVGLGDDFVIGAISGITEVNWTPTLTSLTDGGFLALWKSADTVNSSIGYTLGANVEKLVLTGSSAINGTGNDLDNTPTGNGAANTLDGGVGDDTLTGGDGA